MILRVTTFFASLILLLPFVTANHWSRRHQVAHRARSAVDIHKRDAFTQARFTHYTAGLGACGQTNSSSDWIVALNVEQYGSGYPGPQCFKEVTIQYGEKTATATIVDECMGCPWGGLDFSDGLFSYFADLGVGVLYGTWWYNDDSGGGGGGGQPTSTWTPPSTTWEPPTTTTTPDDYTPSPTSTSTPDYAPPSTTTNSPTYTPPPTTTTTSKSSSPLSSNFSTGSASGLAIPTGGVLPPSTGNPENILVINNVLIELGVALYAAEKYQ